MICNDVNLVDEIIGSLLIINGLITKVQFSLNSRASLKEIFNKQG
jgi:hypothetical protein